MQNWKNFLLKELATLISLIADGIFSDPNVVANKLRQIAFHIGTNKKQ